jgi:hypothetical protein
MKLVGLAKFLHDPDGSGTGDPNPEGDPPTPPDPNASLKTAVDSIRDGIKQAIEASRAPVQAAPVQPSMGPTQATQQALAVEADRVNAQVDELFASGKAAEAMSIRDAFVQKANRAMQADPNDNAIVKTAVQLGERVARTEHKTIMDRWGDEVRRAVDAMPLEARVLPNAWDAAVAAVRSNHFTEILDETVATRVAEEKAKFVPPPNAPGSRGHRTLTGLASKLSEEQVWGADITGVTPDEYAKEVANEAKFDALPFKERAKFPGYPVIDEARGNQRVAPGKF